MSDASRSEPTNGSAGGDPSKVRPDDRVDTELWRSTALELAAAISRGEVSTAEVLDTHLGRIAKVNPSVNAVTNLLADSAREAAEETDQLSTRGEPLGPLAEVPFTVKENVDVAGSATTHGVPAFRQAVAAINAPVVQTAMRLYSATSFVGVRAVAVPTGVSDGLPKGVQVIGGPYRRTCA